MLEMSTALPPPRAAMPGSAKRAAYAADVAAMKLLVAQLLCAMLGAD